MAWQQEGRWMCWVRDAAGVNRKVSLSEAKNREEAKRLEHDLRMQARRQREGLEPLPQTQCLECRRFQKELDRLYDAVDRTLDMRVMLQEQRHELRPLPASPAAARKGKYLDTVTLTRIADLHKEGRSTREIAITVGVHKATASRIVAKLKTGKPYGRGKRSIA